MTAPLSAHAAADEAIVPEVSTVADAAAEAEPIYSDSVSAYAETDALAIEGISPALFDSVPAETPLAAPQQEGAVSDTGEIIGDTISASQLDNREYTIPAEVRSVNLLDDTGDMSKETVVADAGAVRIDVIESEATLFEQRQRIYLTGRVVTKTILDNSGNVLVEEGVRITGDIIDKVRSGGRMVQLVMNNRS